MSGSGYMTCSVLLPVHDLDEEQGDLTYRVIQRLLETLSPVGGEIVIVDDGSPCAVELVPKISHSRVPMVLIRNSQRRGLISSLNIGAKVSRGDLLTYCHSDCLVDEDWFSGIQRAFADPMVGLAVSELWYPDGTLQQIGGWIGPGFRLCWNNLVSEEPRQVHWGDFWTVRGSFFQSLHGLLAAYDPGYWECVDLATSVRMAGLKVITCPGSRITHWKSRTFHRSFNVQERTFIFERNRRIFTKRWKIFEDEIVAGAPVEMPGLEWR